MFLLKKNVLKSGMDLSAAPLVKPNPSMKVIPLSTLYTHSVDQTAVRDLSFSSKSGFVLNNDQLPKFNLFALGMATGVSGRLSRLTGVGSRGFTK